MSRGAAFIPLLALLAATTGCIQKMADAPRYNPLAASDFFRDGMSARPRVDGTVARGQLKSDAQFYTGKSGAGLAKTFPFPVTREVLERGRQRYGIFCAPCHGALGDGNGLVVRRGFRTPPSYHIERLRDAPPGHYFDVVSNGFGAMASYASRIPARDRWAIIAYIRALQLSQNARLADIPPRERQRLAGEGK